MPTQANHYDLSGDGVFVTYSTTSSSGSPIFSYQDDFRVLHFSAGQIEVVEVPSLRYVVSVVIFFTVDVGSTTFNILIPPVTLASETATARVHTYGLTSFSRFPLFPGSSLFAQSIGYGATELNGTASFLNF